MWPSWTYQWRYLPLSDIQGWPGQVLYWSLRFPHPPPPSHAPTHNSAFQMVLMPNLGQQMCLFPCIGQHAITEHYDTTRLRPRVFSTCSTALSTKCCTAWWSCFVSSLKKTKDSRWTTFCYKSLWYKMIGCIVIWPLLKCADLISSWNIVDLFCAKSMTISKFSLGRFLLIVLYWW